MFRVVICFLLALARAIAQEPAHDMSHMQMGGSNQAGGFLMGLASGTSMNPQSWPMPMLMLNQSNWSLMFMGQAFLVDTQETGPRGHDKFYSPNWGMFAASHNLGGGSFMIQTMLSLDPATITNRRFPELFQTGETAYGKPLVDAQHPHDFLMGFGIHYAHPIGENTTVQVYYAPVGDPALGPVAFPHRASAAELPQATLSHHWQDSSHIANNVVTAGIMHKKIRLEASGFYGTEPNENRWNIDFGPMNSWATRVSYFATENWMMQVSVGRLARPERQEAGDVVRSTASIHYTRPMYGSSWSTSLIWGRNHKTLDRRNSKSYLLESVLPFSRKNFVTGRMELVDKDELVGGQTFRIGAYTLGYTRDIGTFHNLQSGIGANFTSYSRPDALKQYYGNHPVSVNIFARFRLK
ncbi:MAG TPA: hypothetical protein VIX89_10895 [Bryobacteraceae bacterium]